MDADDMGGASVTPEPALDREIDTVLRRDACTGCGACTLLDSGLTMTESADGYLRPTRTASSTASSRAASVFREVCPGVVVRSGSRGGASSHPTMGPSLGIWRSWATDPEVRWAGSSGGVLTALSTWLVDSGRAARSTGARSAADPRRSVPVTITTKREALAAAGSRYTPVAGLANPDVLRSDTAVTCKPCEASALSSLAPLVANDGSESPIILSFFCAGTPSAYATETLLSELEIAPTDEVDELWYRGRGWPGRFTARSGDRTVSADYDTSWGKTLGPTTQWRCKVCPDGVGESADVVAADYWRVDSRGYPVFTDGDGDGALIARTPRGLAIIEAAVDAGVIHVEPVPMPTLAAVQPLQDKRRRLLAARTLGSLLAGRRVPRYRGFRLISLSLAQPLRALEAARGTYRRVRRSTAQRSAVRRGL